MTDAVFLADAATVAEVGDLVVVDGPEGHHASVVRRLRVGEVIILADGHGSAVRGAVTAVTKGQVEVAVAERLEAPQTQIRWVVAQALAKGDHADRALDMLTEVGVSEIIPWQASRSIVRWTKEKADKARAKWLGAAREATKQSRRFTVPAVAEPATTASLVQRVRNADLALILHEEATSPISEVELPAAGEVLLIVGPEGGVSPDELTSLVEAGGVPVLISDGVLRTSTAGVVALAGLLNRPASATARPAGQGASR